jgi:uncharacterized protein
MRRTALFLALLASFVNATAGYVKYEYMIPMRDGASLYTAVYVPDDKPGNHPILLERTPYSAGPYGPTAMKERMFGVGICRTESSPMCGPNCL